MIKNLTSFRQSKKNSEKFYSHYESPTPSFNQHQRDLRVNNKKIELCSCNQNEISR